MIAISVNGEYQATTQSSLKVHIKSLHEGAEYACDQCDKKYSKM